MGRFATLVYSDGQWSEKPTSHSYLSIEIHDSDIATVDYRPVLSGSGRFYLGYEPREYFDDPTASAPVDRNRELQAMVEWTSQVLGRKVDSDALAALLATLGAEPADDLVEDTVEKFLGLLGLSTPTTLRSPAEPPSGALEGLSEQELRSRLGLPN